MKKKTIIILFTIFSAFTFSCEKKNESEMIKSSSEKPAEDSTDYWKRNDCLHGFPTKTIDRSKVKNYKFVLDKIKGVGVETMKLNTSDSLVVEDRGCEIYWLSYKYIYKSKDHSNSINPLLRKSIRNIHEINIAPIPLNDALNLLDKIEENGENIDVGYEYFITQKDISVMFQVDEVSFKENETRVEFSFAIGKL